MCGLRAEPQPRTSLTEAAAEGLVIPPHEAFTFFRHDSAQPVLQNQSWEKLENLDRAGCYAACPI